VKYDIDKSYPLKLLLHS